MAEEDSSRERYRNEFEEAVQADMMVNTMIRIAKDLEKVIIVLVTCAGFLGLIAGLLIYGQLVVGR